MIFIITYLILFIILLLLTVALHYWLRLISLKSTYTRYELLDPSLLFGSVLRKIFPEHEALPAFAALLAGIAVSFLFTLIGGLVSPDRSDAPDFAGNELANYFFQSNAVLLIFITWWKYLKDLTSGSSFAGKMAASDTAFIAGAGISFSAIGLSAWGVYHEMYFLAVLFNAVAGSAIIIFLLRRKFKDETADAVSQTEEEFQNPYDSDDPDRNDDLNFRENKDHPDF